MIKAIIFDYDGVIVDSLNALYLTWKQISEEFDAKIKINSVEQYKKIYKNDVVGMLKYIGLSDKETKRSREIYLENIKNYPPKIFDEVKDVLKELSKKYRLVIVSGSTKEIIEKKLAEENILGLFDIIIPIIEINKNKPNPYHINLAIKELNLKPSDVTYIGDTVEDIQAARNANIKKIIAVSYGYGVMDSLKLENPDKIVNSPEDLLKIL